MANNNTQNDLCRVITGECRFSYAHLLKPRLDDSGNTKFSVTLLIPKTDTATMQKINAAIQQAVLDGVSSKWNGVKPPNVATPVHDGDGLKQSGEPFGAECKGHWVMTASSNTRPEVVDLNIQPILDATQVYSGMHGRASIRFFPYLNSGKRGVGCGLNNVQKTRDGEPLSGGTTAEQDFGTGLGAPPQAPQAYAPYASQPIAPQYGQAPRFDPITGKPLQ